MSTTYRSEVIDLVHRNINNLYMAVNTLIYHEFITEVKPRLYQLLRSQTTTFFSTIFV